LRAVSLARKANRPGDPRRRAPSNRASGGRRHPSRWSGCLNDGVPARVSTTPSRR